MRDVVTIGGGTGQYTLLSGLKRFPVRLNAIVSMADDGGSTGMLRDDLGVLPPGDIRQCLVALSESELVMRELFNYRFDRGGLKGHNFGNIFLSALEKITGSFEEAVRVSGTVLAIRGEVIPVTTESVALVCEGKNIELRGENEINENTLPNEKNFHLEPEAYANPKAVSAIESAECIVIGPGNLYCSIIPNLLVQGISEAINRSKAVVVYNCNLMTKSGHTEGFGIAEFAKEIEKYIGEGRIDYVTYNDRIPSPELAARYASEGCVILPPENGVIPGLSAKVLPAPLLGSNRYVQKSGDPIQRTLIRHDSDALATLIIRNCLKGL